MKIQLTKQQLKHVIYSIRRNALEESTRLANQIAQNCKNAADTDLVVMETDPPQFLSIYTKFDKDESGLVKDLNDAMYNLLTPQFTTKIVAGMLIAMVADQILNHSATLSATLIANQRTAIGMPQDAAFEALILSEFTATPPVAPPAVPGPYQPYPDALQAISDEGAEAQTTVDAIQAIRLQRIDQNDAREAGGAALMQQFYL